MHIPLCLHTGCLHVGTAQVYRGRLRSGGKEVAVKVQRPAVRESIALDVFILRFLAQQARERLQVGCQLLLCVSHAGACVQRLWQVWRVIAAHCQVLRSGM